MNIWVLLKQTFDSEEKIVIANDSISDDGVKFIINPYDEYAVEEAIQLAEQSGGKVTVLSLGSEKTGEALRTALAMGADEAVLITDERIPQDEWCIAHVIASYLAEQPVDLILGGYVSIDTGAGQVALRIAEQLALPHAAAITKLEVKSSKQAIVHRDAEGDIEMIEVSLPALFTAQQGLNEPRYPTLPGIMKAKRKPFRTLSLIDIPSVSLADLSARTWRIGLSLPPARPSGLKLKGTMREQVDELISRLREDEKII